jgi:hypothetical protein
MKTTKMSVRPSSVRWQSLLVLGIVIVLVLAACGSSSGIEAVPPTRTPKPTFTVAVSTPTAVSSPTPVPTSTATATPSPTPSPTANPYLNPLTGETVQDPAVLQRRPLLVRIGNDAEVRPQEGLSQADMVFEEAMECFWITRFTAIIWSKDPARLRPIRSARLFTIELGYMFDGALVHSGANDEVRWQISQSTLTDLDELFHGSIYHELTPGPDDKWADPKKVYMGWKYTTSREVRNYLAKTGKEKAVRLPGFTFSGTNDPAPQGEPATYFLIPYPNRALVEYRYDAQKHVYKRWVQGEPHVDALNGEQLASANVIVQYTNYEEAGVKDKNGCATFNIIFTGEGRAQIFRDGVMIEAKWVRSGVEDFVKYVYLDGSPVPLRPGQTWVEVVPLNYQITYKAE